MEIKFSRAFAMPSANTFSIPPITELVERWIGPSYISCDPFARNNQWATYTNDISPNTSAQYHMDAVTFLEMLKSKEVKCDLALLDPPYSPRQISECYKEAGLKCEQRDTQNAALYKRVKTALLHILTEDAVVLSFGWNSSGMGIKRGFEIVEILLVFHGGAHNDTICIVEKRISN